MNVWPLQQLLQLSIRAVFLTVSATIIITITITRMCLPAVLTRFIPEAEILGMFAQQCLAIGYLHSQRILHRDLKSKNVFLAGVVDAHGPNGRAGVQLVKIGDFGIAKVCVCVCVCVGREMGIWVHQRCLRTCCVGRCFNQNRCSYMRAQFLVILSCPFLWQVLTGSQGMANTQIGTPYYMSPEICNDKPYGDKSDVWALGVLLYEMTALVVPFAGRDLGRLVRASPWCTNARNNSTP